MFSEGNIPWNKGLTKETNERVRISSKKGLDKKLANLKKYEKGNRPWNTGKHRSLETRIKLSENNKGKHTGKDNFFYGKQHSLESRHKMSEAAKRRPPILEETRHTMSQAQTGRYVTEETCLKISKVKKGQIPWTKGRKLSEKHRRNIGKANTNPKEETRRKMHESRLLQVFPKKNTSIEITLQEGLKQRRISGWEPHYPVMGQPDIAFPDQKVAIFADGCWFHCCPKHHPEVRYVTQKGVCERDKRVNMTLWKKEWTVLRFYEHEINEDVNLCIERIKEAIELK